MFVSCTCEGETCRKCSSPAAHKIEEYIGEDDPMPIRHPLTFYLCHSCFVEVMGPAADSETYLKRSGPKTVFPTSSSSS